MQISTRTVLPGTAAPFAGVWRSSLPNDLGTEIRTERDQIGAVIRFCRPNGTCVQGAAGGVTSRLLTQPTPPRTGEVGAPLSSCPVQGWA